MTKYTVWVSGGEGTPRVQLYEGEEQEKAANLASALIGFSGSTTFDVGVSVTHTADEGGATQRAAPPAARQPVRQPAR